MTHSKTAQLGVGLIEVLVSLLILAVAILGFVAFQTNAIAITSESAVRTNALTVMRDLGEAVRYNKDAIKSEKDENDSITKESYSTRLNYYNKTFVDAGAVQNFPTGKPTCGLLTATTANCTPSQRAEAEAYIIAKTAYENGFQINLHSCPGTDDKVQCIVAAWNETTPTIGSNTPNCLKNDGTYVSGADCMVINLL